MYDNISFSSINPPYDSDIKVIYRYIVTFSRPAFLCCFFKTLYKAMLESRQRQVIHRTTWFVVHGPYSHLITWKAPYTTQQVKVCCVSKECYSLWPRFHHAPISLTWFNTKNCCMVAWLKGRFTSLNTWCVCTFDNASVTICSNVLGDSEVWTDSMQII